MPAITLSVPRPDVVLILRQYLLTLVILTASLLFGLPSIITVSTVVIAALIDFLMARHSSELALYRLALNFDVEAPRSLSGGEAIRLQLVGAIVSAAIPLISRVLEADAMAQQLFGMLALLTGGAIASFCGFRFLPHTLESPREMLARLDQMPPFFWPLDLMSARPRRVAGALIRTVLGLVFLLPFVAALGVVHSEAMNIPLMLILLLLSIAFQIGFILLSQGLFLLRWFRYETD